MRRRILLAVAAFGCWVLGLGLVAVAGVGGGCWPENPPPVATEPDNSDIRPDLAPTDRRCNWDRVYERLGHTGYFAALGPWYDKRDWDGFLDSPRRGEPVFYRIEIRTPPVCGTGMRMMGGAWHWASFRRDFRIQDLPEGFLAKPVAEIVSFDEASSVVTLHIGKERITWRVPSKPTGFVHMSFPKQ
jgi:hypothetical protein